MKTFLILAMVSFVFLPSTVQASYDTPPRVLSSVAPDYTAEARKAGVEGDVVLKLQLTESGGIASAEIVKGLPFGLNDSAAAAVQKWKFAAAQLNGKPVPCSFEVTVPFRLEPPKQ